MTELPPLELPDDPQLVGNITHFARALRVAGLKVGPGHVVSAVRAVEAAGFTDRMDFYWTLHACFVSRPEERTVFAQVFRLYWRDPRFLEHMMSMMLPSVRGVQEERRARAAERRAAEALLAGAERPAPPEQAGAEAPPEMIEVDARATASESERLRQLDFEQMTVEEMARARRLLARIAMPARPLASRRDRADTRGRRADWRRSLRDAQRMGGEITRIAHRARRRRWPSLVVLCDISGSMSAYSRAVLHFTHALANSPPASAAVSGWAGLHAFTFGTRLTNVTRHLRRRDVDAALAAVGSEAQDWRGGTRIGACLHRFNRDWSRRVMASGAVVLLVTDGLERDDPSRLAREMERLRLSARRVIWINPLLRWAEFAPSAGGIRAMMPHVDCFRAGHNIAAFEALATAFAAADDAGDKPRMMALLEG